MKITEVQAKHAITSAEFVYMQEVMIKSSVSWNLFNLQNGAV